jgi:hypothetical protein
MGTLFTLTTSHYYWHKINEETDEIKLVKKKDRDEKLAKLRSEVDNPFEYIYGKYEIDTPEFKKAQPLNPKITFLITVFIIFIYFFVTTNVIN